MSPAESAPAVARGILASEEARHFLDEVLSHSAAQHTEALLESRSESLTRFANNAIHQNVFSLNHVVTVRAIEGKRVGIAATNRFDSSALRQTADQALSIARLSPEDPDLPELAEPQNYSSLSAWAAATAQAAPEMRARGAGAVIEAAASRGLVAAGAFTTAAQAVAIANTRGVFAYQPETFAHFSCTALGSTSSGWSERCRRDAADLDPGSVGRAAISKAQDSEHPGTIEPGAYTVVLEASAVAELLGFLAWYGLGAQSVQEGRSFLCGRMGEKIAGESVTLRDDASHPLAMGRPFDYEGTARQAITLIENGVARAVVHDRRTALKEGVRSTGHACPPPSPDGPMPYCLVLLPGPHSLEDMIASTERGVLVTRFWYNRLVDQRKTLVTGMTRDGTFLIEGGRVTRGVRNLRFNESVLEALSRTEMVGSELEPTVFDYVGNCVVAPPLKVRDFHFTGLTRY